MSNKTQLQANNLELQTILSTVVGMPTAEDMKHGLYVWRKYEYVPEISYTDPTFVANVKTNSVEIIRASFDLSILNNEKYIHFYKDFFNIANEYMRFEINSDQKSLQFYDAASHLYTVLKYDNGVFTPHKTIISNTGDNITFKKTGKVIAKIAEKTFIDFCISDDPNTYPDKGLQNGYWYEKVAYGLPLELLGCTKYAVDKVIFANRKVGGVKHSLGERPKFFLLMTYSKTGFAADSNHPTVVEAFAYMSPQNYERVANDSYNYGPGYMLYTTSDNWIFNTYQYMFRGYFYYDSIGATPGGDYYLAKGIEYTLITMV